MVNFMVFSNSIIYRRFLFLGVLSLSPLLVGAGQAKAEIDTFELGDTYMNESCWTMAGPSARLERKYLTKPYWRTVAKTRPTKSDRCDKGRKLVEFEWTPKSTGTHTLRQWVQSSNGNSPGISKSFKLIVSKKVYYNPTIEIPSVNTSSPSLGRGLNGCYFDGKKMWGSVYFTKYKYLADFSIYLSNSSLSTDLAVNFVTYAYAANSCGLWYEAKYQYLADFAVYIEPYSTFADVKISTVNSSLLAGLK